MKPELHVMLSFVRSLRERAKDYQIECEETLLFSAVRLKGLVEEYERLRNSLIYSKDEHINKIGNIIPYITDEWEKKSWISPDDARRILDKLFIGCDAIERGLEALLHPAIEPETLDKLRSLREKLEELEKKGLGLNLARNLREAIDELEQGHHLASTMISARVVRYIVENLPGRDDDEKVENMVEMGIVHKDRKDEQKKQLTTMRLARNYLSHRVDLFPEPQDALLLLAGAFKLAELQICTEKS
jgi:hypothetical protein